MSDERCPTCGWPTDADEYTLSADRVHITKCPGCGLLRPTYTADEGTSGFVPYTPPTTSEWEAALDALGWVAEAADKRDNAGCPNIVEYVATLRTTLESQRAQIEALRAIEAAAKEYEKVVFECDADLTGEVYARRNDLLAALKTTQ